MNLCVLIGRICAEPEIRYTQTGKAVASYRIAVDRPYKKDSQAESDFINCVAWGSNGEFAGKYLHKGMKVAIEGRIQIRNYDDKDGKKVYVTEVVVDRHEFCESKKTDADNATGNYTPQSFALVENSDNDDFPF